MQSARFSWRALSDAAESHWSDLNRRPPDYESGALPLSYSGGTIGDPGMPWRGFEPRRLSALPPQDSVSTSFTTRARRGNFSARPKILALRRRRVNPRRYLVLVICCDNTALALGAKVVVPR